MLDYMLLDYIRLREKKKNLGYEGGGGVDFDFILTQFSIEIKIVIRKKFKVSSFLNWIYKCQGYMVT